MYHAFSQDVYYTRSISGQWSVSKWAVVSDLWQLTGDRKPQLEFSFFHSPLSIFHYPNPLFLYHAWYSDYDVTRAIAVS